MRVEGIAPDDLVEPLRAMGPAANAALRSLLADEFSATRCGAAWMLAELTPDEVLRGELLAPLLTDVVPSVRIVAAMRLVDTGAYRDRSVRLLTAALLADDLDDPVIYSDFEGGQHRGSPLAWADEMIAATALAPRCVVETFVAVRAKSITGGDHLSWTTLPGERHVRPLLRELGAEAHDYLVDELIKGDDRERLAVRLAFAALEYVAAPARKRLEALREDERLGLDARTILDNALE